MLRATLATIVVALVAAAPAAAAETKRSVTLSDARVGTSKAELIAQREHSATVIRFFTVGHRWMIAPRRATCWKVPWAKTCNRARQTLRAHRWLHTVASRRYDKLYGFPATGDWKTAVEIVQRWFPGTAGWLLSCSSTEGGHGEWVYFARLPYPKYGPTRTPGGPMQYMSGTFYGDFDSAVEHLAERGVQVPSHLRDWYSILGQAIAAGWAAHTGNNPRGKWTGAGC